MAKNSPAVSPVQRIQEMIFLIRGQRVMLDLDLAKVYGVELKRLNEQARRNAKRFPDDFAFQVTVEEFMDLRSQNATGSKKRNLRYLPWAFTEHGAIMLASVLNSEIAVAASVRVVRAFVAMREQLAAHEELAQQLNDLETRAGGHDAAIENLFEAIRQLVEPPLPEKRRQIGFLRETGPRYRFRRTCRN